MILELVHTENAYFARYEMKYHDFIPKHNHQRDHDPHDVSCIRGAVIVYDPDCEGIHQLIVAGENLAFDSMKDHVIVSLSDNTVIYNRYTKGKPSWWKEGYREIL